MIIRVNQVDNSTIYDCINNSFDIVCKFTMCLIIYIFITGMVFKSLDQI